MLRKMRIVGLGLVLFASILELDILGALPVSAAEKITAARANEAAIPLAGKARAGDRPAAPASDSANPLVIGVTTSLVPPDLRASLKLPRREGILITTVLPNSPSQKAGLLPRDVVLALDGQKVARRHDLVAAIQASQGQKIWLEVIRDDKRLRIQVKPVRSSAVSNFNMAVAKPVPTKTPQRQVLQQYLSCLHLAVVRGRLTNLGSWPMFGSGLGIDQGALREDLDSGASNNSGCVDYECISAQEVLRMEVDSVGYFACSRLPANGARVVPVGFVQAPGEPLVLTVGNDAPQVYRAATIWHLLLGHPEACRRHLLPLLMEFRADWELDRFGMALETEVLRAAEKTKWPDRARWPALVKELGNNDYAQREYADSQLRAAGPVVLEYLQQLNLKELDWEQAVRIRRIIASLAPREEETPEQVANSMVFDPSVWLVLLERPDRLTRRAAAKQLERLLGSSIPVDPAADPATQMKQRGELRVRILEAEVLRAAGKTRRPDRARWPALVEELGNNDYAQREFADYQLRAAGPGALEYLQQLNLKELDLEQAVRIRRIIASLARRGEEPPEPVANSMVCDPSVWLVLLGRPDPVTRRAAAKQLERLLGSSIPVDPAADPATQTKQREELRARMEKMRPEIPKP